MVLSSSNVQESGEELDANSMEMNQNYQMISRCANLNGDRFVDTIHPVWGMDLPKSHPAVVGSLLVMTMMVCSLRSQQR